MYIDKSSNVDSVIYDEEVFHNKEIDPSDFYDHSPDRHCSIYHEIVKKFKNAWD